MSKSRYNEVGEVFEKDGRFYIVRESKTGTCHGCAFYGLVDGMPECKGMNYACDFDYREDDKNVVFEELENIPEC